MPNNQEINAWKIKNEFTLVEAAFLLIDKIPVSLDDEYLHNNTTEMLLDKLLNTVKTDENGFFYLYGFQSTNQFCSSVSGYDEKHKYFNPPHENIAFPKEAFSVFAKEHNLKCEVFSPATEEEKQRSNRKGYTNTLLKIMDQAISKFWLDFDPSQPDTAPKNQVVEEFILSKSNINFQISKDTAQSMAQIIRHDSVRHKSGRRKKSD